MKLVVFVPCYSFSTESIIQAAAKQQAIATVKIKTNPKTRESRQFKYSWQHVLKSSVTIARTFATHSPLAVFLSLGFLFLASGAVSFARGMSLAPMIASPGAAHPMRPLIVGASLLIASFVSFALGIIADSVRVNRLLLEDILEQMRRERRD